MDTITIQTPAKINLTIDILRKREDGYHELCMVMQTVELSDKLTFTQTENDEITVECDKPGIPCDRSNLVYKAAKTLKDEFNIKKGVNIRIEKRIPAEAGLAGGSTNAAGTLAALRKIWELDIPEQRFMEIAKSIGADVPYCTKGGTALAEGIGEKITRLGKLPIYHVVLIKPDFGISTAWAFGQIDIKSIQQRPDNRGMIDAVNRGDRSGIESRLSNAFESAVFKQYPELEGIKAKLKKLGADAALMTGSGPTMYGLFRSEAKADAAYDYFKDLYVEVYKTKTFNE
ncbi:MAG: 4-(cytidine 5'-diphospho)-2-C-methyl-D-erythritol kinase [Eubacteriaceae bacterium]|nr:4-(cytidine 5'-diphospho)-2-C-methyl-D-erythritol kinase [Eubacteriaceae bacterium]